MNLVLAVFFDGPIFIFHVSRFLWAPIHVVFHAICLYFQHYFLYCDFHFFYFYYKQYCQMIYLFGFTATRKSLIQVSFSKHQGFHNFSCDLFTFQTLFLVPFLILRSNASWSLHSVVISPSRYSFKSPFQNIRNSVVSLSICLHFQHNFLSCLLYFTRFCQKSFLFCSYFSINVKF